MDMQMLYSKEDIEDILDDLKKDFTVHAKRFHEEGKSAVLVQGFWAAEPYLPVFKYTLLARLEKFK
jgi:hypothetical protein